MTSLLNSYEQQFGISAASITAKMGILSAKMAVENKKPVILQIMKELEEAKDILEQMELEIRELDAATRQKYATRVESYIAELCRLEKEFKLIQVPHQEDRNELFDDNTTEEIYDQKQCLISNGEKLERGVNRLGIGYQLAIETEQIGNNILSDLNQQRETMQRTRNRLRETDEELHRSGRLLNRMMARIVHNRLILVGLALLIFFVFAIVLYVRFHKSS